MSAEFVWPVRVYYEDTDAGGVVYHANFLRFMERARNEWLRQAGYPIKTIVEQCKTMFVVRSVQMKFIRPAYLDDALMMSVSVIKMKRASMLLKQQARRESEGRVTVLMQAEIELATVSSETFKPIAIPTFLNN